MSESPAVLILCDSNTPDIPEHITAASFLPEMQELLCAAHDGLSEAALLGDSARVFIEDWQDTYGDLVPKIDALLCRLDAALAGREP